MRRRPLRAAAAARNAATAGVAARSPVAPALQDPPPSRIRVNRDGTGLPAGPSATDEQVLFANRQVRRPRCACIRPAARRRLARPVFKLKLRDLTRTCHPVIVRADWLGLTHTARLTRPAGCRNFPRHSYPCESGSRAESRYLGPFRGPARASLSAEPATGRPPRWRLAAARRGDLCGPQRGISCCLISEIRISASMPWALQCLHLQHLTFNEP
jgi:hypothetical protein